MPKEWAIIFIFALVCASACNKFRPKASSTRGTTTNLKVSTTVNEFGVESATVKAGLNIGQDISVSSESPIAGTALSFPPLGVVADSEITIEEAAPIATASAASQLGLGENIAEKGIAIVVRSSEGSEPAFPYTITLPAPPVHELLTQDDASTLVVFYKIKSLAKDQILLGFIPFAKLKVQGDAVNFSATHFGAFQAAYTKLLLSEAKEVSVTTSIQSKGEVLELVPFEITGRTPFIVSAGDQITVTGTAFRPTMTMTFGGSKVFDFNIESENSATFFPPIKAKFGITDLTANQDGIEQTITVLYRGTKTDLPLITLTESEVCSEYKYYDIVGDVRAGTRGCDQAAASLTDGDFVAHQAVMPRANCWRDGQTNCVTTDRFKSADTDGSAISALDIRRGKIIGGISGGMTICNDPARLGLLEGLPTRGDSGILLGLQSDFKTTPRDSPGGTPSGIENSCSSSSFWQAGGIDSELNDGFCNDADDQCSYQDLLSKFTWSAASASPLAWTDAQGFCRGLISGNSDWRLPTAGELIQAANNGIGAIRQGGFLATDLAAFYWSVTPDPSFAAQNWSIKLADGAPQSFARNSLKHTICVRP
jgi:hypothetical protein